MPPNDSQIVFGRDSCSRLLFFLAACCMQKRVTGNIEFMKNPVQRRCGTMATRNRRLKRIRCCMRKTIVTFILTAVFSAQAFADVLTPSFFLAAVLNQMAALRSADEHIGHENRRSARCPSIANCRAAIFAAIGRAAKMAALQLISN